MGALGGLVYLMSICMDIPVKIGMGLFSKITHQEINQGPYLK